MSRKEELSGESYSQATHDLMDIASQAGAIAHQARSRGLEVSEFGFQKGFVSSGDIDADRLIHDLAAVRFPSAKIYSEETAVNFDPFKSPEVLIVDPIDSTRTYKDGGETWSILLSRVVNGELANAVTYHPDLNVYVHADKGVGAFVMKDGIRTKIETSGVTDLREAKIGWGTTFAGLATQTHIAELSKQITRRSRGPFVAESSGLELALLARGVHLSAYIHPFAKPWDKAAGILTIREAGGVATGWPGQDELFGEGVIAAATPELYEQILELIQQYMPDDLHKNPDFDQAKFAYFQNFVVRAISAAPIWKQNRLINAEGSKNWRNVVRHQVLSGAVAETIMELAGESEEEVKRVRHLSLIHDADKREQVENQEWAEIWRDEMGKNELPLAATGNNFSGFDSWDIDSYVLRYVDSSIDEEKKEGEEKQGYISGGRDPKKLPRIIVVPWRQRVQFFMDNRPEEGELGIEKYGMTTWEKLWKVMEEIEVTLHKTIIEHNPGLAEKYPKPPDLTRLIEDRLHEKILEY